jgi:hypothetical protein
MEAFIIHFNDLLICTLYKSPSQKNMQTFKTELKYFFNTIHKPKLSIHFTFWFQHKLARKKSISNFFKNNFSLYNAFPNRPVTTNKITFIDWFSTNILFYFKCLFKTYFNIYEY